MVNRNIKFKIFYTKFPILFKRLFKTQSTHIFSLKAQDLFKHIYFMCVFIFRLYILFYFKLYEIVFIHVNLLSNKNLSYSGKEIYHCELGNLKVH